MIIPYEQSSKFWVFFASLFLLGFAISLGKHDWFLVILFVPCVAFSLIELLRKHLYPKNITLTETGIRLPSSWWGRPVYRLITFDCILYLRLVEDEKSAWRTLELVQVNAVDSIFEFRISSFSDFQRIHHWILERISEDARQASRFDIPPPSSEHGSRKGSRRKSKRRLSGLQVFNETYDHHMKIAIFQYISSMFGGLVGFVIGDYLFPKHDFGSINSLILFCLCFFMGFSAFILTARVATRYHAICRHCKGSMIMRTSRFGFTHTYVCQSCGWTVNHDVKFD